jgi:hypothetical protein
VRGLFAACLAFAAGALPSSQQYLWPSLPLGLQTQAKKMQGEGHADDVYDVRRFGQDPVTLWLVSGPISRCKAPPAELVEFARPECPVNLYLQDGRAYRHVGTAHGAVVSASPETDDVGPAPLPTELRFSAPLRDGPRKQERLTFADGGFAIDLVAATVIDPLTYERLTPEEIEKRARSDIDRGHYPAAAGRLLELCQLGCSAELFEYLGLASLKSAAPARAEAALRESVTLEPNRASAWLLLGDALVNLGKTTDARKAYAKAEKDPALVSFVKQRREILDSKKK